MNSLTTLLFSDIPLSILSITFCLSFGDIYLYFGIFVGISLSFSFVTFSELFYCESFGTFVILSAILLRIKSPITFAIFGIALFKAVLNIFVAECLV